MGFGNGFGLSRVLRTLRSRNFRFFFAGQGISLIGSWMQRAALSWLVYRLTRSAFLLGFVEFSGQLPALFLVPFAGVLADRWDRRRFLLVTQSLAMVQALVLSVLVLVGTPAVWQIVLLSMFLGVISVFDIPTRQSFIVDVIESREDIGNAIALNSSLANGARLIGPPLAGLLIASAGEWLCFLLNGLSYLAAIAAVAAVRLTPRPASSHRKNFLMELRRGVAYVFGFAPIRSLLLQVGLISLAGLPFTVLLPIFAKEVLHGDAATLGLLMGATGFGAFGGALYLAARSSALGLETAIVVAAGLFGLALIGFGLSSTLWLSLLLLFLAGFGMIVQLASCNTILQTVSEEGMRGRVMSYYTLAFIGLSPFGSLLEGLLAHRIGAPNTVIIGGGLCLLGAFFFGLQLPGIREKVRPIYVRIGILPEIAKGVQPAAQLTTKPEEQET
jgi:MFS family permease